MTRHHLVRLGLGPALGLCLAGGLGACGDVDHPEPTADAAVLAEDARVRLVDQDEADLVLYVSNQSFDDDAVDVRVQVDGVTVVDGTFHVEGQHTWVELPLALPDGEVEVSAVADSGAELRKSLTVPRGKRRWAVLGHWTDPDPALTWQVSRRPVAFG